MGRGGSGLLLAGALLLAGGCLQIETRIKLREDGTALVTERVWFSRRLLDMNGGPQGEYARLLGKERCLERMKGMGEGVALARHEMRACEDGSMESVAEFEVADLDGFRYVSPWLGHTDYAENSAIRVRFGPRYKRLRWDGDSGGTMAVRFEFEKPPRMPKPPAKDAPSPAPLDEQVYRDIAPVLREMLRDFRIRLTFEGYAPPLGHPAQCRMGRFAARSAVVDLLDVSDSQLDSSGYGFFDDEEKMLEIGRLNFGGPKVQDGLRDMRQNFRLPMFLPFIFSARAGFHTDYDCLFLPPSRALFDKHFAGKTVNLDEKNDIPARFEDIGWRGWEGKTDAGKPAPAPEAEQRK